METKRTIAQKLATFFKDNLTPEAKRVLADRAEAMMYNAAILIMNDDGESSQAKDILRCYTDLDFVTKQLALVMDRDVYSYWTNNVPDFMKTANAKDVIKIFNDEFLRIAKGVKVPPEASLARFVDALYPNNAE